jgi:hypothetical protein
MRLVDQNEWGTIQSTKSFKPMRHMSIDVNIKRAESSMAPMLSLSSTKKQPSVEKHGKERKDIIIEPIKLAIKHKTE